MPSPRLPEEVSASRLIVAERADEPRRSRARSKMRESVTRERLLGFMQRLAEAAPRGRHFRVYVVGGGTAVAQGWRESTIDVDLYADDEAVFRDIQRIEETQQMNVEFARPEHFVPPLAGVADRHIFIATFGGVSFFHYDPYSQVFSKVVRGFRRDLEDAHHFIDGGLVDAAAFGSSFDAMSGKTGRRPDRRGERASVPRPRVDHEPRGRARPPGIPTTRGPYFTQQSIMLWLAFDDATLQNRCVYFLPGSHKSAHSETGGGTRQRSHSPPARKRPRLVR